MKRKKDSFSDNFPLIVFTITYILSCFLLYWIFISFTPGLQIVYKVILSLAFLIASFYFWIYLYMLFSIPQKMAGAFDYIKNNISNGKISDSNGFAVELTNFLISFFNYSFLDIQYVSIKFGNSDMTFSSENISKSLDWQKIIENSVSSPEVQKNGKVKVGDEKFHCYTIPIYFCEKHLGLFTIFTRQRLGRIRINILSDLEDNFIDDQLFRVMPETEVE